MAFNGNGNAVKYQPPQDNVQFADGMYKDGKNTGRPKWPKVLLDYSQDTTVHGVKQIFQTQPFLCRRFIWLLLLLAGLTLFLLQVYNSVTYYLTWPVSVDVQINYNSSILFPAVTICNINSFRLSAAHEHGYVSVISHLFNTPSNETYDQDLMQEVRLDQLYLRTKHRMEDLIVSCTWGNEPCLPRDFKEVFTDFGVCYVFNDVEEPRKVTQKGTAGGLRLQLNIEQYEYMYGPNQGAGLKILLHTQGEIPLVQEQGLAVGPGSHAFVGLLTLELNNLGPKHGVCGTIDLEHFKDYTMAKCEVDRREEELEHKCACRDKYMPASEASHVPVCTLQQFVDCVRSKHSVTEDTVVDSSATYVDDRDCPVPCHRVLYQSTVSYGASSNFDINALLKKPELTQALHERLVHAKELGQRLTEEEFNSLSKQILDLSFAAEEVNQKFSLARLNAAVGLPRINSIVADLQTRLKFHRDRGLVNGVQFVIEHDFLRGWQMFQERALPHVAEGFYELPNTFENVFKYMSNISSTSDKPDRELAYVSIQSVILARLETISRAEGYLERALNGYVDGEPLLTYTTTIDRRYDLSYISLELLRVYSEKYNATEYFEEVTDFANEIRQALESFLEVGQALVDTGEYNETAFQDAEDLFHSGCRGYNYRLFMVDDRIIQAPVVEIQDRVDQFDGEFSNILRRRDDVIRKFSEMNELFEKVVKNDWPVVMNFSRLAVQYLTDSNLSYYDLCEQGTSEHFQLIASSLPAFFQNFRLKLNDLVEDIQQLEQSLLKMWGIFINETSVNNFYDKLHEDGETFLEDPDSYEEFIRIFANMLRMKKAELRSMAQDEIIVLMNADYPLLNYSVIATQLQADLDGIQKSVSVDNLMGSSTETFLERLDSFLNTLQDFLDSTKIDANFYKENFMRLDIFMQELSYEEVTQQKAYDIPKLLSDIGGSMGLFVGGSMLSVFEVFDVFAHNIFRQLLGR